MIKATSYEGLRRMLKNIPLAVCTCQEFQEEVSTPKKNVPKELHAAPARMNSRPRRFTLDPSVPMPVL